MSGGGERLRIDGNGNLNFNSGFGSAGIAYGCRAWVNFNGTGTVAVRGSGNVSSITDNGVGDYTINFAAAMPDANYTYSHAYSSEVNQTHTVGFPHETNPLTSSSLRIVHFSVSNSSARIDKAFVQIAVFR